MREIGPGAGEGIVERPDILGQLPLAVGRAADQHDAPLGEPGRPAFVLGLVLSLVHGFGLDLDRVAVLGELLLQQVGHHLRVSRFGTDEDEDVRHGASMPRRGRGDNLIL